jgi:hypothetical protein
LRKSIIIGAAVAASLAVAGTAQADVVTTNFDGFNDGSVDKQGGWQADNVHVDQSVVPVADGKALRVFGSFGDMPHSVPVTRPASENDANNMLVNEFTIQAPATSEPGLAVTFSPDEGLGSRMSRVRFEDHADGVHVLFADSTFVDQDIATLDRSKHSIKIATTFVKGDDNDVVRVFIDGTQVKRGGSWENYYREQEERNPSASDRLLIRTAGVAAPASLGSGFLVDDVTTTSTHVDNPAPLNPPSPGPVGAKGDNGVNGTNGTNGADGKNGTNGAVGVTTIIHDRGHLTGATMRTLRVHTLKGKKLVSVRASLRGKRLHTSGRKIKVDLRGKTVGNYNVVIAAKYKTKHGKLHTVRSVRTLSITRS